jgi:hypothetical protein
VDSVLTRPCEGFEKISATFPTYTLLDNSPDGHAVVLMKVRGALALGFEIQGCGGVGLAVGVVAVSADGPKTLYLQNHNASQKHCADPALLGL